MSQSESTVFIVDDDEAVRDSLKMLVRSIGLSVETFASADDFLESYDPARPGCLILDIRMPGMSGLELHEQLRDMNATLPIIFITGHGDIPMAVQSIKAGAIDFIPKPFRDQELIDRIQQALEQNVSTRKSVGEHDAIAKRIDSLTPREREVMEYVAKGEPNKAIAYDLSISERTVEVHRARVMEKMKADSLPDLVQMVMKSRQRDDS